MNELRPVNGFEGIYSVSSNGRVWSHRRTAATTTRNYKRVSQIGGRWLTQQVDSHGYAQVVFCHQGRRSMPLVHRLVAEAFIGNESLHPQINHIDGNKLNNHVDNLEWVTNGMNQSHAWATGLQRNTLARQLNGSRLHHTFAPWRNK